MLNVKSLSFAYDAATVLKDISFTLKAGGHLSIIGESGSGKTTLLKLIYGEYDLLNGQIFWKDNEILGPKYNLVVGYDFIKFVSQEFDLMPYTSVEENIGKYLSNIYRKEKKNRITELLEVVELSSYAETKVKLLSGGQKQRVALARALAKQPEIILMDEPFSHIDNFKKQSLRRNLFAYLKDQNISCIVATHDKSDVLPFSEEIIVLNKGEIIAKDHPKKIYNNPKLPLIASFFGEFNQFKISDISSIKSDSKVLVYAHEIELVQKSEYKIYVQKSFYLGINYLIKGLFKKQTLYFNHSELLNPDTEVYFRVSKNLINQRQPDQ